MSSSFWYKTLPLPQFLEANPVSTPALIIMRDIAGKFWDVPDHGHFRTSQDFGTVPCFCVPILGHLSQFLGFVSQFWGLGHFGVGVIGVPILGLGFVSQFWGWGLCPNFWGWGLCPNFGAGVCVPILGLGLVSQFWGWGL